MADTTTLERTSETTTKSENAASLTETPPSTATLADLIGAAHVHRAALGERGAHNARKALLRIAERTGATPAEVPARDVLAAHAAVRDAVSAKQHAEEHTHLQRLLGLPTLPPSVGARVFAGTATLADAHAAVSQQPRGDAAGKNPRLTALEKITRCLSTAGDGSDLPAGRRALDLRLDRLSHHDLGVRPRSAATIKSQVRAAAALVDVEDRRRVSASMLSGAWAEVIGTLREQKQNKGLSQKTRRSLGHHEGRIWPLVAYAWRRGVAPAEMDDATIQSLLRDLEQRGVARPFETARNVVYAWEALQDLVPGWPPHTLSRLYAAGTSVHDTPFEELPAPLRAAWDSYAAATFAETSHGTTTDLTACVVDDGPRDGDGYADPFAARRGDPAATTAASRRRSPDQKADFRTVVTHAANAAIHELGKWPKQLADLMDDAVVNRTLQRRYRALQQRADARGEPRPAPQCNTLKHTVSILKAIASDLGMPQSFVDAVDSYYDDVHPDVVGRVQTPEGSKRKFRDRRIGPKHAVMLEQFATDGGDRKLLAWFELPRDLLQRVERPLRAVRGDTRRLSDRDLNDGVTAVAAALLQCCPVRRENLAELRLARCRERGLDANLYIPGTPDARHSRRSARPARIHLTPWETKSDVEMTVVASQFATRALQLYRDRVRPELLRRHGSAPENPYLFPGPGLRERPHSKLTRDYRDRARQAGFELDLHCNRHLTAKIVLDRDPSAMALIQRILGHKSIKTTEAYYAEVNDKIAQQKFQRHLAEAEADLTAELGVAIRRAQS